MKGKTPHHADVIAEVFKDLKIRSAVVPENFPASMADRLRKHRINISVQPDPFFPPVGDAGGNALAVELEDGSITVSPIPEPATILLLASGFFGMRVFGRKGKHA